MKSDDPRDKLQAALNHDNPDKDMPVEYLAACREWYAAMASRDKAMADAARDAFDKGEIDIKLILPRSIVSRGLALVTHYPNAPNLGRSQWLI